MSKTYYILEDSIHCAAYYENWQEIICGLEKLGWKRIENVQTSDIVLVVHCCITVVEIEKVMQILANLSKERILGKIFLGECISQIKDLVDAVKETLPNLNLYQFTNPKEFFEKLGEEVQPSSIPILGVLPDECVTVDISYGCKRKCTFCKVAYMQRDFYSVSLEEILEKVQIARRGGAKKVILNAMNSTEYNDKGRSLLELLTALLEIPDIIYQVNGIVLAELNEMTVDVLRNPKFVAIQMELQSFIPQVRKKMEVGLIGVEKILSIFEKIRGKLIFSTVMTGFYGEDDGNFREQLRIIEENNLFFLSTNSLIATPGTKAAKFKNPSTLKAQMRMIEVLRVLSKLRRKMAEEMFGEEQEGIVFATQPLTIVLCDNGVMVKTNQRNVVIGQRITVTPVCIMNLCKVDAQEFVLSTEEGDEMFKKTGIKEEDELEVIAFEIEWEKKNTVQRPNMTLSPLNKYCREYLDLEMKDDLSK